jgi:iron complex outermembrane receptor protein
MDLPQSIQIITQKTLQNQQITTMADLLKNTNGVYIMGNSGGYQEEIASRGYAMGSSNTFKNGVRYFNGMPTEMSGIEKAEFLKGSAAILYGNVTAGGVLNLVTKKPKFEFGADLFGNWKFRQLQNPFRCLWPNWKQQKSSLPNEWRQYSSQ